MLKDSVIHIPGVIETKKNVGIKIAKIDKLIKSIRFLYILMLALYIKVL